MSTVATAITISAVRSTEAWSMNAGQQDDHERRLEQDDEEAGHDAGDQDVEADAGQEQAEGQRDADRGEDRRERRPAEEAALEGDRQEGELRERHDEQQADAVLRRIGDDRLDLGPRPRT